MGDHSADGDYYFVCTYRTALQKGQHAEGADESPSRVELSASVGAAQSTASRDLRVIAARGNESGLLEGGGRERSTGKAVEAREPQRLYSTPPSTYQTTRGLQ